MSSFDAAPQTFHLVPLVHRIGSQAVPRDRARALLDLTLRAPENGFTGDVKTVLAASVSRLNERATLPEVGAVTEVALRVFWAARPEWKASAINLAGAGFFNLGWYPEAFECYVLAVAFGIPLDAMNANFDEVRAYSRVSPSVSNRDLARIALLGREMRQLLFELDESSASMLRAEMFEQQGVPTWARMDLLRASAATTAAVRLVHVMATLGDPQAMEVVGELPQVQLAEDVRERVSGLVSRHFAPKVNESFGTLLARF